VWAEFLNNLAKWLKITCYLALAGVAFDFLKYLPPHIADRVINALLNKLGI